jgi:hypothetical protein
MVDMKRSDTFARLQIYHVRARFTYHHSSKTARSQRRVLSMKSACLYFYVEDKKHKGAHGSVSWLRHYATSRKFAGSIPDEVTGFFN